MTAPELSVVIPFLDEEHSLPILRRRLEKVLPGSCEVLLVSDGSSDGSVRFVESWAADDPRIRLIELTRNFGHQAAIRVGLEVATGDRVAVMDADLQDAPEDLAKMDEELRRCRLDLVYGVRASRQESFLKRAAYRIYYLLFSLLSDSPADRDAGDFCVLSRRAVDLLLSFPERVQYLRGLRSWAGLKAKAYPIHRASRQAGTPQYTLRKLLSLAINGIVAFSDKPLRMATFAGGGLCALSLVLACGYIFAWMLWDIHVRAPGFTTLAVLMLFLSGAQMLLLGLVGEYIRQIFLEVKGRPVYIVARTLNLPPGRGGRSGPSWAVADHRQVKTPE